MRSISTFVGLAILVSLGLAAPAAAQGVGNNPRLAHVMAIQDAHTPGLMARSGVLGTATGLTAKGEFAVVVYVNQESASLASTIRGLPEFLGDAEVVVRVTDPIRALKGPPSKPPKDNEQTGTDHRGMQTIPIQLGTSGGWGYDLANGYCCGGTLGALIQVGGRQRILSNYHVFEADIVSGGNSAAATTGDPIIQPGLIDVSCNAGNAQEVATLVKTSSLSGNNVDASSANVIPEMVDSSGSILEVGTISSETVAASINQNVKKSGRTTGLTRSRVEGLNATVSVAYDNECAGSRAFVKTFTGQIIIRNRGSKFIAGGDSGSLMVEDENTDPGAVGLLFAGSSQIAVANPIDEVLSFLKASMVGN